MAAGGKSEFDRQIFEADQRFTQLVAGVRDYAIFLLDQEGYIQTWNAGAERIKGYAASEIIGKHFSQFYPAESIAAGWPQEELIRAKRDGRFEDEGWRIRKDGSRFWSNVVITPVYARDGAHLGFLKITRDLTDRRQTEEALRQSEERLRLFITGVKEYAIFMLDADGHVMSWNGGAERIKGYTAEEIIGKHFSEFYPSEDVASGKPARELQIARAEGSVEDEGWRVRKDRSLFWANVVITAIYDAERRLIGFAKVTRDMTDRRKVDQLELADKQKNEFLAMLAHELRNPLAPISNGLQVLKLPNVDDATAVQTRDMMERQVLHMVRLVDDLLDISRIITGKLNMKREPLDLTAVMDRAIEDSRTTLDTYGHELVRTPSPHPIVVDGDSFRLSQVISNVLQNAAKYSDQPGQIWLSAEQLGLEVLIRVKDSGIGIAEEMLPRIFDIFVQADNSLARPRGGLGIGLNLVKRIVERHGGRVEAFSEGLGKGSEFQIRLPVSHAAAGTAKSAPTAETTDAIRRRVLIVDDNIDAALTTSAMVKAWGHDVEAAHSGTAALEAASRFKPEFIVLDIGLPGMSGYEVARELRSNPSTRNVVLAALTGYGQDPDRQRSLEAGFDYHLTKPADPSMLRSLLSAPTLLRSSRPPRT